MFPAAQSGCISCCNDNALRFVDNRRPGFCLLFHRTEKISLTGISNSGTLHSLTEDFSWADVNFTG